MPKLNEHEQYNNVIEYQKLRDKLNRNLYEEYKLEYLKIDLWKVFQPLLLWTVIHNTKVNNNWELRYELIAEGMISVWKAIGNFDYQKLKHGTIALYIRTYIEFDIKNYFDNKNNLFKISKQDLIINRIINNTREEFLNQFKEFDGYNSNLEKYDFESQKKLEELIYKKILYWLKKNRRTHDLDILKFNEYMSLNKEIMNFRIFFNLDKFKNINNYKSFPFREIFNLTRMNYFLWLSKN